MNVLYKANKVILRIEEVIIAAAIIIMALTLIANVLGRLFFNKGVYAAEEIGQYCIYAVTFYGLSYAVTKGQHIHMLGLFDIFPNKVRKIDAILISLVTGATMGVLTYIAFAYVSSLQTLGKVSVNLHVPAYLVVLFLSFGLLFTTIQYILLFIKNLTDKKVYLGLDSEYVPDLKLEKKKGVKA
jgi:TRAP-type C4-dicarboxylate transport system permease small subunit